MSARNILNVYNLTNAFLY